ncbi:DUF3152 domain-containing protein [Streptomyces sp. NPDC001922]|uniref:DUF3152 domain-containing protein n=1 Tax=Streptomyces sp. NPDC001922 TaxID=3364624 RepID=UPI0036978339
MGRHSRRGRTETAGTTGTGAQESGPADGQAAGPGPGRRRRVAEPGGGPHTAPVRGHSGAAEDTGGFPRPQPLSGTPPQGVPRMPPTRGGHPEHRERGGAWGTPPAAGTPPRGTPVAGARRPGADAPSGPNARGGPAGAWQRVPGGTTSGPAAGRAQGPSGGTGPEARAAGAATVPQGRGTATVGSGAGASGLVPKPRQEYLDAFEEDVFTAGAPSAVTTASEEPFEERAAGQGGDDEPPAEVRRTGERGGDGRGGKGRTLAGITAAAVTTVLAVVVAGQVADGGRNSATPQAANDLARKNADEASRSKDRPTPARKPAAAASYQDRMAVRYPLDPRLAGSGDFAAVPGGDTAPGKGQVVKYRVDVEKDLPLDRELFARAVHRTLNDERSWGHGDSRTFERVSGKDADWVITLASPGTTATWCAKAGLDTTVDNVSCDAASTERIMINAYRWAQGAKTYGDKMFSYREMLINHEVGHRLGRNHESCEKQGALAPVMMQQTKFLATDGVVCKPNAWPFPEG